MAACEVYFQNTIHSPVATIIAGIFLRLRAYGFDRACQQSRRGNKATIRDFEGGSVTLKKQIAFVLVQHILL